jgi:hypothetical protein
VAKTPVEDYKLLVVTGRAGGIQNDRSSKLWKMPPPGGNPYEAWKGIYFDENSWDGSDMFCLGETAHIVVVERLKQALTREGVTNIEFVPLADVERLSSEL